MSEKDADYRTSSAQHLPAIVEPQQARHWPSRFDLPSSFAAQLIAERDHLEPQRTYRRAPANAVVGLYKAGTAITTKRMPAGYRYQHVA